MWQELSRYWNRCKSNEVSRDTVSLVALQIVMRFSRFCKGCCAMIQRVGPCALFTAFLSFALPISAQEIDAIVTAENRKPATIADEIQDPGERAAYVALYVSGNPQKSLSLAQGFLQRFPQSAFLATAYEIAARSSFDLGEREAGLKYARLALRLYPENPLLLVAVA